MHPLHPPPRSAPERRKRKKERGREKMAGAFPLLVFQLQFLHEDKQINVVYYFSQLKTKLDRI